MKCGGRIALAWLVAIAVAGGLAGVWTFDQYRQPGPLRAPTALVVPRGEPVAAIADRLAAAGVIRHRLIFRLGARIEGAQSALRAGEYAFPARISVENVVAMLRAGAVLVRRLTVPEGLTSAKVVALVNKTEALEGDAGPPPAEGALLPETYNFTYGESRAELIARMTAAMTATLDQLWAERAPGLPLTSPTQALTLASIVEKETAVAGERPRIAAVFLNRLKAGMRLQADPTVAYALIHAGGLPARSLTREDLDRTSPYNTYLVDGLPPGPIANPGRAALVAVMNPSDTDELYFVADGSGGHAFSRTLEEHKRKVADWVKVRKQRQESQQQKRREPGAATPDAGG